MKYFLLILTAVLMLCGCTSFAVYLELPGVESANVALSANAVKSLDEMESGAVVKLTGGVWHLKLKEGKTSFSLPFEPGEMLVSVRLGDAEGVVRITSIETVKGEIVYESKALNTAAAKWEVTVCPDDKTGLRITINTSE